MALYPHVYASALGLKEVASQQIENYLGFMGGDPKLAFDRINPDGSGVVLYQLYGTDAWYMIVWPKDGYPGEGNPQLIETGIIA